MKKNYFITLCWLLTTVAAWAQDYVYIPMPTDNAIWYTELPGGFWGPPVYGQYHLSGDTLVNSNTYHKVYRETNNSDSLFYVGAYREADKRVYVLIKDHDDEILQYDFSLEVGAVLPDMSVIYFNHENNLLTVPNASYVGDWEVIAIDTVVVNGSQRKKFTLRISGWEYSGVEWIEGIGGLGIVQNMCFGVDFCFEEPRCFEQNGEVYHVHPWIDPCEGIVGINPIAQSAAIISVQANTAASAVEVRSLAPLTAPLAFMLYDLQGRTAVSQVLSPGASAYGIDVAALPVGIYVYTLADPHGGVVQRGKVAVW